jgi:GTP cyclohydrolase II
VVGNVVGQREVLVRIHSECFTGDVLGSLRCDCGEQLDQAMKLIAKEGSGVLIYLRQEGRGIGLLNKLRAYNLQDQGYDTVDANLLLGHGVDERDYTIAAGILKDLGVLSVRLLTNNPLKIESLQDLGIAVAARVPLQSPVTPENASYLLTKMRRMRHLLSLDAFSGVVSGANSERMMEYVPSVETPTQVLVENDNGLKTKPQRSVEVAGQVLVDHEDDVEALVERATDHRQRTGRPFVTLSYAQSVDGCIAARPGKPLALSGTLSLTLTHRLRAAHDAILVGIGTVLADNPRLTVRLVKGKTPQPIVADSRLRFPLDANLLRNHPLSPWIATSEQASEERQEVLEAAGARVLRLPANAKGQVDLAALLERLGELGINSLMVEGGARIITSVLSDQLVDYVVLTVAPMLVGGLRAVRRLGQSDPVCLPRLRNLHYQRLEEDLVLWGDPAWEEQ